MAPQAPESLKGFLYRLRAVAPRLETAPVRFGSPHFTHAVVQEGGRFRVRALVLSVEDAEAYRLKHGHFMPEDAERLSEPTGEIVMEAPTLEALIAQFEVTPLRL